MPATAAPSDARAYNEAVFELLFNALPGDGATLVSYKVLGAGKGAVELPGHVAGRRNRVRAACLAKFRAGNFALRPRTEK